MGRGRIAHSLRRAAGCALLAWAVCGQAAAAPNATLAPSAALACLTPAAKDRGQVAYPPELLARKDGATVPVELVFKDGRSAPEMKLRGDWRDAPDRRFVDAVQDHVQSWRVPCMADAGPPTRLQIDFDFVPNDGRKVMASGPHDTAQQDRRRQLACLTHVDGEAKPTYPAIAQGQGEQGHFVYRMVFSAPDQPPATTLLAYNGPRSLSHATEHFQRGLRLPCLQGAPVSSLQVYNFKIEGGSRDVLRDMSLLELLQSTVNVPQPAYFDLQTMGCPFALRLTYYQPHASNTVQQLDNTHPARQALMDWLSRFQLRLPERLNTSLVGQSATVSVPCGTIDL